MKQLAFGFLALGIATLSGCDSGNDRLREKANIEGEQSARRQSEAENDRLRQWGREMEEELAMRHRFFEGVSGTFEGTLDVPGTNPSSIRIVLNPSIPRFPDRTRDRTIEELSYELNNLFFVGQATTTHPIDTVDGSREDGYGCTFESIRPDLRLGKIYLVSEGCNSTFTIFLAPTESDGSVVELESPLDQSTDIASRLMEGNMARVDAIAGYKRTNISSRKFSFRLRRVLQPN